MEDSNSCPAFIEREEGPFTSTFEIHNSPNLSRLSLRFGSAFLNNDSTDENTSPGFIRSLSDDPPTPPYRKAFCSPKRTPPSPSVLNDITNQSPASGIAPAIKRRCVYSPRRSSSTSAIPIRRLYDMYEVEGDIAEEPPSLVARKRPFLTSSTSSLPDFFAIANKITTAVDPPSPPAESTPPFPFQPPLICSDSAIPTKPPGTEDKHEEERVQCILPTIPGSSPDYNRIDGSTVDLLLAGHYDDVIEKYVIMDCRYDYEYNGGHIRTAVHMSPEQIFDYFRDMPEPVRASTGGKRRLVIIMHCEYSTVRAPACIRLLRHYDRSVNHLRGFKWPLCSFPDVYLLDGGYRKFFDNHKTLCEPQNYVPENAKQHQQSRVLHKRSRKEQLRRSQSFSA